jgi:hypothetical protein
MFVLSSNRWSLVSSARSFATYLAGSQYMTWLSLKEVFTSIVG